MKMNKNRLIIIIFVLFVFLFLHASFVFSLCPDIIDAPSELRNELRTLILNFLSDPSLSPHNTDEILDLLNFYKNEKDKSLVTDCGAEGSITKTQVYSLMDKTLVFERECTPSQTITCGQTNVGVCEFGTQTCQSTYLLGPCVGEVRGSDEICDNLDNNCDDQIDEGLDRSTNELGACSINTESCIEAVYVSNNEYEPVVELDCDADNIDNDCDGSDAPTCDSIALSSNLVSIPADGAANANIIATRIGSDNNLIITFSSDRAEDTLSATTCDTKTSGGCSIFIKSLEAGISTITATAPGYVDGNIVLTFTNIKPTAQLLPYTGPNTIGSEITLECEVNDINTNDNPVNENLAVKVWAGQCEPNDEINDKKCFETRSWATGIGEIYHNEILMDAPVTGKIFTKKLLINQDIDTGLAATCQATDLAGDVSAFGDAYPLLTVGCSGTTPTFNSITASPNPVKAGAITITFTASDTLANDPIVTLKKTETELTTVPRTAAKVSQTGLDYTYTYIVSDADINGLTEISVSGQTSLDSCSQGSSLGTFNIDTQDPSVTVSVSSTTSPTTSDIVTITATGNDVDKDGYQSGIKKTRIFVDDVLKQTCTSPTSSPCSYSSTYTSGTHTYYAEIEDNADNVVTTETKNFVVTSTCLPSAETCNNIDDDCNGIIDNGCDDDIDNYCDADIAIVGTPNICTLGGNDCNDNNKAVHPGITEPSCDNDNVDNDCDGGDAPDCVPTCSVPTFLTPACSVTSDSITLLWNSVAGATFYTATKCDANGQNCDAGSSTTASSKSFIGLSANTQYTFRVKVSSSDATCTSPSSEVTTPCTTTAAQICTPNTEISRVCTGDKVATLTMCNADGTGTYELTGQDAAECEITPPPVQIPSPSTYSLYVQPFLIIPSDVASQYSTQASTLSTKLNDVFKEIREWYLSRLPGKNLDIRSYTPISSSRSKAWHECRSIINENGLNCNLNDPFANALKAIQEQKGLNIDVWTNQPCDRKFIILFYKHVPGYAGAYGFQNPRNCVTVNGQTIQSSGGTASIGSGPIYAILNDVDSIEKCYEEYEGFGVSRTEFPANNCPLRNTGVYTIAHELGHTLGVFDYCGSSDLITTGKTVGLMHPFESDLNQAKSDCQLTYSGSYQQSYADDSIMGAGHRNYPFTSDTGLNTWEKDALNRDPFFFS